VTRTCASSLCMALHRHAWSRRIRGDGTRRHPRNRGQLLRAETEFTPWALFHRRSRTPRR
jgi:hypothetical protein